MARIGEDRRIHRIEPAPAVPDTPEPLIAPAPATDPGAPATEPATPSTPSTAPAPATAP